MILAATLAIQTSAFAKTVKVDPMGAGEWDAVYANPLFLDTGKGSIHKAVSASGNIKVEVTQALSYNDYFVTVYEEDEAGNPSEFIDSKEFSGSDSLTVSTTGRVDDSNGKAEIRVIVGKCNNLDEVTGVPSRNGNNRTLRVID
ncbi:MULTISPECIES: hypothetical protein [Peribacillus]|uniref:hypothetical protein n=1 Tax=Peribacillus frigoritolerans TaxID=450367 RepID=UPI003D9FD71B